MKSLAILILPSLAFALFMGKLWLQERWLRRQLLNRRVAESCRYRVEPTQRHPARLPARRAGGGNGAGREESSGHRFTLARCA